jgi:uncharacterized protein YbbK (DUF523 family)
MQPLKICLVSSCLVGLCTRYDGQSKPHPACLRLLNEYLWIPVCPEQLGGMPTPRPPAQLVNGDGYGVLDGTAQIVDQHGNNLSAPFLRGAAMVLQIAQAHKITRCFLKAKSPSCGLTPIPGVTSALLMRHGVEVISF